MYLTPLNLLARLAVQISLPQKHRVSYHSVLAPLQGLFLWAQGAAVDSGQWTDYPEES